MASASPEPGAVEETVQAVRRRGLAAAPGTLAQYGWQRLRTGELGPLPVIVALAIIWTYFQTQESVFLSARNLSNLVLQIAVTGTIAIGIVLVLLLGEIDLSVGSVAILCSAILGAVVVRHGVEWWQGILIMLAIGAPIASMIRIPCHHSTPCLTTTAPRIAEQRMATEPTERSISPSRRTRTMPIAIVPVTAI